MTIDFSCQKCDASFEVDAADLMEGNDRIKCPNCDARVPQAAADDLANALAELCKQLAALRKKFACSLALESDDLPPPYDLEEEDEEDEDEGEDEEDDLLDSSADESDDEEGSF
jgi:DNA-directed RNA polymerase subunit RPC12/RpoP